MAWYFDESAVMRCLRSGDMEAIFHDLKNGEIAPVFARSGRKDLLDRWCCLGGRVNGFALFHAALYGNFECLFFLIEKGYLYDYRVFSGTCHWMARHGIDREVLDRLFKPGFDLPSSAFLDFGWIVTPELVDYLDEKKIIGSANFYRALVSCANFRGLTQLYRRGKPIPDDIFREKPFHPMCRCFPERTKKDWFRTYDTLIACGKIPYQEDFKVANRILLEYARSKGMIPPETIAGPQNS